MPNPAMERLTAESSNDQVQAAIGQEIEVCMNTPGADQKQCAAMAHSMAKEKTGKALDFGK